MTTFQLAAGGGEGVCSGGGGCDGEDAEAVQAELGAVEVLGPGGFVGEEFSVEGGLGWALSVDGHGAAVLPQNRMGLALAYGTKLWDGLCRYLGDGEIEIDSNLIENAIRPTAVGKMNFLFIGHPDAGWRSAMMYSIVGSCRRRGINPEAYVKDVLNRLPDMKAADLKDYTPGAWAKKHPEARVKPPK